MSSTQLANSLSISANATLGYGYLQGNYGGGILTLKFSSNTVTADDNIINFNVNSANIVLGGNKSGNNLLISTANGTSNSSVVIGTGVGDFLTVNSNTVTLSTVSNGKVSIANNGSGNQIAIGTLAGSSGNNMTVGTGVGDFLTVNSNTVTLSTVSNGTVSIANNGSGNKVFIGTLTGSTGNNVTIGTGLADSLTVNSNNVTLSTVSNGIVSISNSGSGNQLYIGTGGSGNNVTIGSGNADNFTLNSNTITLGNANTKAGKIDFSYNTTFKQNVQIDGNLTITGCVTSTNTIIETLVVQDSYVKLACMPNQTASTNNVGLYTTTADSMYSGLSRISNNSNFSDNFCRSGTALGSSFWYLFDSSQMSATQEGPSFTNNMSAGCILQVGMLLSTSDERLKTNIVTIDNVLDRIDNLNGVYYNWKDGHNFNKREIGVIAQNIEKEFPELIFRGKDDFLTVDYPRLTGVLIEGVKELRKGLKELRKENKELRSMLIELLEEEMSTKKENPKKRSKKEENVYEISEPEINEVPKKESPKKRSKKDDMSEVSQPEVSKRRSKKEDSVSETSQPEISDAPKKRGKNK